MTAEEEHALLQRWNATLLAARAGREGPDPAPYGRNLLARWAEPQRRYHTVDHLRAVLDRVDELTDQGGEGGELELVRLAAWFHDAVYRPDRSENEERSALLAEKALTEAGLTPHEVAEVARLVRLTVTHDPDDGDLNGETLCDADLAILASDPDTYARYAAAVREEYAFVPEDTFREGRAAVLRHLLDLPRLFRTPYGAAVWEEKARENVERELKELRASS
ncbi:HD domain-containing protein [Streptomyces sp. NPDC003444]|uniref:HD domain-containing protein n=1 Tax=Streptomyces sp. S1 TaxID=718288 RepID=UPI003D72ACF9